VYGVANLLGEARVRCERMEIGEAHKESVMEHVELSNDDVLSVDKDVGERIPGWGDSMGPSEIANERGAVEVGEDFVRVGEAFVISSVLLVFFLCFLLPRTASESPQFAMYNFVPCTSATTAVVPLSQLFVFDSLRMCSSTLRNPSVIASSIFPLLNASEFMILV
jgi:hypothetical protein